MVTRYTFRQSAFSSGEVSPLLEGRPDFLRVKTGASIMAGFLPLRQGAFTRAPGTLFRGNTDENAQGRLIDFEFAADDAVILEFTANKMRVWRYGALVDDGGSPYELATPYDMDAIARLVWEQAADVIYLADGVLPIQKLSRFALDNWSIEAASFTGGPFRVQNLDEALTLQADGETGTVTLTASAAFFEANHVGSLIRLEAVDYTTIPLWTGNKSVSVGDQVRYGGNIYELTAGTNTGVNPPTHTEGIHAVDASTSWEFVSDGTGIVEITAVTSGTEADATVVKRLPMAVVDDPTYRFAEGAWSDRYGYPSALAIFDQRLIAAATPSDPRTLWFSTGGAFTDFEPSTDPDGSFAYAIAGQNTLNRILWLKGGKDALHIGALGEEYSTRSTDQSAILGPTTTAFTMQSTIGSAATQPIAPDGWPVFIAKDGARIFELRYSLENDAVQPRELSLPSDHLGAGGFKEIVWQSSPLRLAWIRRETGDLVAMVHEPREDVLGFVPYPVADGVVESIAVASAADTKTDVLTMIVRREIDGQTVRMVEEQALTYGILSGAQPIAEAVHLFAAAVFEEDPETDTFNVPHLEGQEVEIWTDRGRFGPKTVSGGQVTIESAVGRAVIGLFDASHRCRTLPFEAAAQDGDTLGRLRRILAGGGVKVHRTAAGRVRTIERDLGQVERVGRAIDLLPGGRVGEELTQAHSGTLKLGLQSGSALDVMLEYLPVGGAPMTVLAHAIPIEEAGA